MNDTGINNLIVAIVKQATQEYVVETRYLKSHPEPETENQVYRVRMCEIHISQCEHFFRSDWFRQMMDVDPDELIKRLDQIAASTKRTRKQIW